MRRAASPATLLLGTCLVATLPACGGGGGGDAPAAEVPGGPLRVDGLLVIDELGARRLFDPSTERLGPPFPGALSVTPELARIVHRQDEATVVISRVGRAPDGTPTLTPLSTLAHGGATGPNVLGARPPAFNAQGDRVDGAGWWDPATGAHLPLGGVTVSPDGRHHVAISGDGDGVQILFDDFEPAMIVTEEVFTSDGQWLVGTDGVNGEQFTLTHVPSHTRVLRPDADRPERGFPRPVDSVGQLRLPYAGSDVRGRLLFYAGGRRGLLIPPACGTPEALVGPIPPITQVVPAQLADGAGSVIETPLEALHQLPAERGPGGRPFDGFEWAVVGLTPDGRAAIVQHRWYTLERAETPGCPVWSFIPQTIDLFRVELGGDGALQHQVRGRPEDGARAMEAIANGCGPGDSLDPSEPLAFRHRRAGGLQFVSETDWLCGTHEESWAAYLGGVGRIAPRPAAWPTLDRASLLGAAETPAAARYGDARVTTGLCQGPISGGLTACVVPPDLIWSRHVVAQVGIDLLPRASTGPVVTALSQRAATPGTTVRLLGYGFGATGRVHLGDVELAPSAISAWSDKAIVFTMPADAPDVGPVRVTDASGAASTQRHLWLGRSEPWSGAPVVPHTSFLLRQGVNRITFPGAGAYLPGIRSLSQILPGGGLATLPDGAGPDHLDAVVPTTPRDPANYLWMTFQSARGLTFRPLTITPGLGDEALWQPFGGQSGFDPGSRFVTTLGLLHLTHPGSLSNVVTPGGPTEDWALHGVTPSQWTGFRDGDELWRRAGPSLGRLTEWTLVDGVARTPSFTDEILTPFPNPLTGAHVHGSLVVAMTQDVLNGQTFSTLHLSRDRGASFVELLPSTRGGWSEWAGYVEGPRPGLYGRVAGFDADGVMYDRVARVTPDGALEISATVSSTPGGEIPCTGGRVPFSSWLLCHDQPARRLYALDVSVADGEAGWQEAGGALAGHVTGLYAPTAGAELLIGTDEGGVFASADLASWSQRDQVTLGPVSLPLLVLALGVTPEGALVAAVQDERSGNVQFVVRAAPPPPGGG